MVNQARKKIARTAFQKSPRPLRFSRFKFRFQTRFPAISGSLGPSQVAFVFYMETNFDPKGYAFFLSPA